MFKNLCFIVFLFLSFNSLAQSLTLSAEGENSTTTSVLDSIGYHKVFKDYLSLSQEVDSLHKSVRRLGYINSYIVDLKQNDSTYTAFFNLDKRFYTIYIYYTKTDVSKEILNLFSDEVTDTCFKTTVSTLEHVLKNINTKIASNGNPFSTLQLSNISQEGNTLKANLVVTSENKKRYINSIIVKGYEKFPKTFLKHYLKLKPTTLFNLEKLQTQTKRLYDLPFANQIKPPEVLFTEDSTVVYLYIEKRKSNNFDGFLGFGTNKKTNNIDFNGYLDLSLTNNLNFGETLNINYKSDENEQRTFNVETNLPYLFGSPLGINLKLNLFKNDSTFTTSTQQAKVFYQINAQHHTALGIKNIQSNNLLNDSIATATVEDYKSTFYTTTYNYTKQQFNNLLFRRKTLFTIEAGTGERTVKKQNEAQHIINIEVFNIFNLNAKNSIYARATGSSLFSNNYFENELQRFGGINSIRGFEENSLRSTFFGVLNIEYRLLLSRGFFIHTITDAAYFKNNITSKKEKLFGFGFGFGTLTKAGLLRFIYANGKSERQPFKFSNSKIHLSLTAYF